MKKIVCKVIQGMHGASTGFSVIVDDNDRLVRIMLSEEYGTTNYLWDGIGHLTKNDTLIFHRDALVYRFLTRKRERVIRWMERQNRFLQKYNAFWHWTEEQYKLTAAGIRVQVVEARAGVRERLRAEGLHERLGGIDRFTSVADAVADPRRVEGTQHD